MHTHSCGTCQSRLIAFRSSGLDRSEQVHAVNTWAHLSRHFQLARLFTSALKCRHASKYSTIGGCPPLA
ncbi:hypothetical protein DUNSADRAFT_8776 [Dunaliella salina]|uniref:Encoded protein n=1 Tax=Dunaliella salina TaxID=3046 RepID=A0ABQ7GIU4_DUNSA|nr:hypothetical protein DUNSADRAFT_8776 [Dunaliella salina]|eukprot:KAF5834525.1 hypothetical protein DUNSADRAFT_8776 [Dunaliella salina]